MRSLTLLLTGFAAAVFGLAAPIDGVGSLTAAARVSSSAQAPVSSTVASTTDLLTALRRGGRIQLAPGRYSGTFVVGVDGTRLDGAGATLEPADPYAPTLRVTANDVTVSGVTILGPRPDRTTVEVGSSRATTAVEQPHRVRFEHVRLVAGDGGGLRGFALHGVDVTVTDSRVEGYWFQGRDAQAIWVNNGPGPYTLTGNYLEGSGEVILFGGDSVAIRDCVPADIVIRGNTLTKPEAWRQKAGSVKNLLEFKNARRALVEDNVLDGNWRDAQDGSSILLTPRNQYGDCPWCVVADITIRRNTLRRATQGYAVNILGIDNRHASGQTTGVTIDGNLFADARNGIRVSGGVASALVVRRNTFPAVTGSLLQFTGAQADGRTPLLRTPLTFVGNVAASGEYGVSADNLAPGLPALSAYATLVEFRGNVIETTAARTLKWPDGTTLLSPGALAGRLDAAFKYRAGGAGY